MSMRNLDKKYVFMNIFSNFEQLNLDKNKN